MSTASSRLSRLGKLVAADVAVLPDKHQPKPTEPQAADPQGEDAGHSGSLLLDQVPGSPVPSADADKQLDSVAPTPQSPPNAENRFVWLQGEATKYNWNSDAQPASIAPAQKLLAPTTLCKGDLGPRQGYTPIVALSKYPYWFIQGPLSQRVASTFFDAGKFWAREWDLFYIWDIDSDKTILLVSEQQFQSLLDDINAIFSQSFIITPSQREDGMVTHFPSHSSLSPRYLGRSKGAASRADLDNMAATAPDASFRAIGEPKTTPPAEDALKAFKAHMEALWELQKSNKKKGNARKKQERLLKQQVIGKQFKRAQRYLGLRPSSTDNIRYDNSKLATVDPTQPVPYSFDLLVVFVCVDVEAYERAHHQITEIGISTLDTNDLKNVPPGPNGENWKQHIHTRHFRIKEHAHLNNSEFIQGCADRFEFGTSEFVSLKDAPAAVATCFHPPFCAPVLEDPDTAHIELNMRKLVLKDKLSERNLILLGHDTETDIRYLQQLGFNPLDIPMLEALDTASLYRYWRRDQNTTSLGKILYDFEVIAWNLHNAGNDAFHTLQAMLCICIKEATIRGTDEVSDLREQDQVNRLIAAREDARARLAEEAEGWSDPEQNDDGGVPVPITLKDVQAKTEQKVNNKGGAWRQDRGSFAPRSGYRGGSPGRARGGRTHGSSSPHVRLDGTFEPSNERGRGRGWLGRERGFGDSPRVASYGPGRRRTRSINHDAAAASDDLRDLIDLK